MPIVDLTLSAILAHFNYRKVSSVHAARKERQNYKAIVLSNFYIRTLIFVVCFNLASCASVVSRFIEQSESFDYLDSISDKQIADLGFTEAQFCLNNEKPCISYLSAPPIVSKRISYTTELASNRGSSLVSLSLERNEVPEGLRGTVVLLHGFRASKEFMLNSALYFRFLGFNVVNPDLLGHGESGGEKQYGVGDAEIINALIDQQIKVAKESNAVGAGAEKLYVLGNSMGCIAALHLSQMREDITGIILQAPMLKFDLAVNNYINANTPLLARFFTESTIEQAAIQSLQRANVMLEQTDTQLLISGSNQPVLLFASNADAVAPYSNFVQLASSRVNIVQVQQRNHPSMAVIGDSDSNELLHWLSKH